ncbi:response regulator [Taibaiella soli]|uniref:histidine kinase n=1 Tax=Taibaiella soli TaxID=1649169 RepID=A0A2W2AS65_9BACT|nr:response regulator [Taibaiella soli]PZF70824.1 histidine kinase [Taibaiella soli]
MDQKHSTSSIIRQLQFVFGVSLFILLVSALASYYSNKKLVETSVWVNHTHEVIIEAENLLAIVRDAESGQRGYVITQDPVFLSRYDTSYEKALGSLSRLRGLTTDNSVQQHNLADAKTLIDRRFEQMNNVITMMKTNGVLGNANLTVTINSEMFNGKKIMEDLRLVVQQIKEEETRLLKIRTDEQSRFSGYTQILVVVAALISILISVLAYFRIKADLSARIQKQKEDEALYLETAARITAVEGVTKRLEAGDLTARAEDKKEDQLGRISSALNEMAISLESNFTDLQKRNWLQAGEVMLADAMRTERFLNSVSDKIIGTLANYVSAAVGTLYVIDGQEKFRLTGTHAITYAPKEIHPDKGLIGQAVTLNKLMVVDEVPNQYLTVNSSLGNTEPLYLILVPFSVGNEVMAVAELGTFKKPLDLEIEFLKANTDAVAISLSASLNYERMQNLLEETQAQSEELQVQHNELENINAELEAQSEKLQASEEELRVQQEELQQANAELEERSRQLEESNQKIAEQNVEVKRKAEELALTTKYKSEFLANMSHELRTPLNSILLLGRLLSENNDHNLSSDQVEYANVIQSSGYGLLALIDEILDLSKIEAGKMVLEYETVAVRDIVNDMRSVFEPMAAEKKLQFIVDVKPEVPYSIETDKMRLEQIIKNLISNALKFTAHGSISLKVSMHETITNAVNIVVTDTGIGIAEGKQKLIFEAFQQADGSTRRKYGGTGLGLSISKELTKLLNGTLSLESEQNIGSSFTITIPLDQTQSVLPPEEQLLMPEFDDTETPEGNPYIATVIPEDIPDDRSHIRTGDKSILIIEDDTNFAKSLLEYTRQSGYKGIVSVRGDLGFELARKFQPTGILLDIQLPVVSGWDVMKQLKDNVDTRHIPVHMMSAFQVKKQSMMEGAIDFINKPVAFEQIQQVFQKLEEVLSKDPKKVLIVEDNSKHAKALAYFLETYNINSEIRHNVADSVDALQQQADCVILDMGIPTQKAYDMLEEVKKKPGMENLPIIIFTGKSLSLSEEQRIKQYADSIVVKTAHSYQRILDEISIFLHLVEESKKPKNDNGNKKLAMLNDVLKDKTVLIVDDDVRNIFSVSKALERFNMNVVTATDGKDAMIKLEDNRNVDLVLLDMMMPEMDGYETATKIRENQRLQHLPVIAVTAKAMTGDRDKCIKAGASDYISKPVDIDQLLSLLRVWLYEKN